MVNEIEMSCVSLIVSSLLPLVFIFPPLLNTHLSLPPEVCDVRDQAAHYHVLSVQVEVWGLYIHDPEHVWLQCKLFSCIA